MENTITQHSSNVDPRLQALLHSRQRIREQKSKRIEFSNAILYQNEQPVIFPRTINVIQGKAGVHKSRLAETICAALLRTPGCQSDLLNFHTLPDYESAVCYVDTERNLSDQLPYALQQIQLKAGFKMEDHPPHFDYISLLEFDREERFQLLNLFLQFIRQQFKSHIFIVLDVITDCVFNFNDSKDSMGIIDLMNQFINKYDVTFLCLIHENPGSSDKARGHLGTEILNKSSTVLQIRFETDANNEPTDYLKVSFLKCRNSKKHEPFYVKYSETQRGLCIAGTREIYEQFNSRKIKALHTELCSVLTATLTMAMHKTELFDILSQQLDCKNRTLETRLKDLITQKIVVSNDKSGSLILKKSIEKDGVYYSLVPSI